MVTIPGNRRGGRDRETPEEEDMDRLKPLHNFNLPYLKWGNQKLLRCMKVDSKGDRNQSSESSGGGGLGIGTPRRDSEFNRRFRFRSSDGYKMESDYRSAKVKAGIVVAGDGEIEATRAKLMFDFQTEVGKMKDAILREQRLVDPPPSENISRSPAERPWNLRTRRAAYNGDVLKPNSSPVRNECKKTETPATTSGEKRERAKFSVSLSRQEVEEDYMAMAGRRLPRKPKKRPRAVQKQLDTLFPGLWLSEITADMYKVAEESETGKR